MSLCVLALHVVSLCMGCYIIDPEVGDVKVVTVLASKVSKIAADRAPELSPAAVHLVHTDGVNGSCVAGGASDDTCCSQGRGRCLLLVVWLCHQVYWSCWQLSIAMQQSPLQCG